MKVYRFKLDVPKYIYPVGRAGDEMDKALKEGKIVAAYCEKCDVYYMPPTKFCPKCFSEITRFEETTYAYLDLYTILRKNFYGEDLPRPKIYGFIRFEVKDRDVQGGLIHHIYVENLENLTRGVEVKPVFKNKEERRGVITDILYFKVI